jgi:hypothetical protein
MIAATLSPTSGPDGPRAAAQASAMRSGSDSSP